MGLDILLPFLVISGLGCQQKTDSPQSPAISDVNTLGTIYPHSVEFKTTSIHKIQYRESPDSCRACHVEIRNGEDNWVACQKCHAGFPHITSFKSSGHGGIYFQDSSLCSSCHGTDFQGKSDSQSIACSACHEFPHILNWSNPSAHGPKFIQDYHSQGKLVGCQTCHASTSEFKNRFPDHYVSCATCHLEMPHTNTNEFINGGHASLAANYSQGQCLNCHQTLTSNLPNYSAGCYTCHGSPTTMRFVIVTQADGSKTAHWENIP